MLKTRRSETTRPPHRLRRGTGFAAAPASPPGTGTGIG